MIKFWKLMFMYLLMISSIMSISSLSWFYTWMGLEINMLSFISLMKTSNNKYSSESITKYFMTQTMASFILLFSIIKFTNSSEFNFDMNSITSILMSMAIFMKMGAAPLHFWLPEVASGISWNSNLILLTWQKIAPMVILSYTGMLPQVMILFIVTSSIIGSMIGLNQTCMRKILAYSSINHIGWMLSSLMCSMNTWLLYFLIYSLINFTIIKSLNLWKINFISQMNKIKNNPSKMMFMLNFFSLGGLPPFTGFMPKWMTINQLSNNNMFILALIMIIFTLLTLYYYLRISFSSLLLYSNNSLMKHNNNNNIMSIFSLSILPLMIFVSMFTL
uniref:NADH-ubiquinone oxidoreductase chain 2 n=1 Tax=Scolytinae sp. BMNH 1274713 TaxID=1796544 RepID=A0A126TEB0_9CUCU|nr:NADH dehydrogenase subunit 2 [Scolytinae sp. BMNH 1274713]